MKTGMIAALCLVLAGCSTARIGDDVLADFGTDAAMKYYEGGAAPIYVVMGQNQSKGLGKMTGMVNTATLAGAAVDVSGDIAGVVTNRDTTGAATDQLRINRGADSADLQTTTGAALETERIGLQPDLSP